MAREINWLGCDARLLLTMQLHTDENDATRVNDKRIRNAVGACLPRSKCGAGSCFFRLLSATICLFVCLLGNLF